MVEVFNFMFVSLRGVSFKEEFFFTTIVGWLGGEN
jgi:hypothetical protein